MAAVYKTTQVSFQYHQWIISRTLGLFLCPSCPSTVHPFVNLTYRCNKAMRTLLHVHALSKPSERPQVSYIFPPFVLMCQTFHSRRVFVSRPDHTFSQCRILHGCCGKLEGCTPQPFNHAVWYKYSDDAFVHFLCLTICQLRWVDDHSPKIHFFFVSFLWGGVIILRNTFLSETLMYIARRRRVQIIKPW